MRVVVVGATGNVGSSLVRLLAADERVGSILGVARRRPELELPKTDWAEADVTRDDLADRFRDADVVVHLAWAIQPSRDERQLHRVNVEGSARVFDATASARVPALVYASSVGAYSPGPKDRAVDESWAVEGIPSSFYSRHKAEVERRLDRVEAEHPRLRVVRLRPGLIFKASAATGIRRLFAGPFAPGVLLRPGLIPFVPAIDGLRFQAVHTDDVADAYLQAIVRDVRGAFNIAAEPVLDAAQLAELLHARPLPLPRIVARSALRLLWRLRLQPTPPGWLDLALAVPLMNCSRAVRELGWKPERTATEAMSDLLSGFRAGADDATPPLAHATSAPARVKELATGVGARDDAGDDG
ncbi:MAG TPA: NAD-dependent epimerase/dehydratase family protein [Gaiellaceae bacterium]|nr:NAD-dependent epimerase/dehydratase family protein [Gaiellaceae bacterium]